MSGILGTNYGEFAKQVKDPKKYDQNAMQAAADVGSGILGAINTAEEFVVPHAKRDPLNPMAYVKDVNEWFEPAAQMAIDESQGEAEYPGWAYGLAATPIIGKVAKPVAKAARGIEGAAEPLLKAMEKLVKGEGRAENGATYNKVLKRIKDNGGIVLNNGDKVPDGYSQVYLGDGFDGISVALPFNQKYESFNDFRRKVNSFLPTEEESFAVMAEKDRIFNNLQAERKRVDKNGWDYPLEEFKESKAAKAQDIPIEDKIRYNYKKKMAEKRQPAPFTESDGEIFGYLADSYGISTDELSSILGVEKPEGARALRDDMDYFSNHVSNMYKSLIKSGRYTKEEAFDAVKKNFSLTDEEAVEMVKRNKELDAKYESPQLLADVPAEK